MARCCNCKFWVESMLTEEELGECRFMPPSRYIEGHYSMGKILAVPYWDWPVTHEDDWCGQYQENEETQDKIRRGEQHD